MELEQPSPTAIKKVRLNLKLTQTKAAEIIYKQLRTWQQWESGDRKMDVALWELFLIKNSIPLDKYAR